MSKHTKDEIASLLELSARIGRNALLTQASTGNTSVKIGPRMWVKASGTWLADAVSKNILTPVDLARARDSVRHGFDPAITCHDSETVPRPSIETALHAVLPHTVVIHVHSVNLIAWAVRRDGGPRLAHVLDGLRWSWIPYVPSGLPLASELARALSKRPDAEIFVLGNHGLVVGGETCARAEALLWEVERRVALTARRAPRPDEAALRQLAGGSDWRLADNVTLHALATDPVSTRIVDGGLLYPCQAIFSRLNAEALFRAVSASSVRNLGDSISEPPFLIVNGLGVLTRPTLSPAGIAVLTGLAQVVRRIPDPGSVRYLTAQEISALSLDSYEPKAKHNATAQPAVRFAQAN